MIDFSLQKVGQTGVTRVRRHPQALFGCSDGFWEPSGFRFRGGEDAEDHGITVAR